ncbi:hypothetical protein D3C81_1852600 [compost metagenome]
MLSGLHNAKFSDGRRQLNDRWRATRLKSEDAFFERFDVVAYAFLNENDILAGHTEINSSALVPFVDRVHTLFEFRNLERECSDIVYRLVFRRLIG